MPSYTQGKCEVCTKAYKRQVRANSKYCSRECFYLAQRNRVRGSSSALACRAAEIPIRSGEEQAQIIWAAGFFDGEGCVSISQSRKGKKRLYYSVSASAFQKVRPPIDLLHDLFGGAVRPRKEGGWLWVVTSQDLINALTEMLPYLVVKGPQAEVAITFQSRKVIAGGKYANPEAARQLDQIDYGVMRALKG